MSILILVLDRADLLLRCLDSLSAISRSPTHEVIVVANGTPAAELRRLEARDDIVLVPSPVNLGFAGACNWATRFAAGRHLVLLNDDTEVEPTWLASLVAIADSDPRIGAVGSRLLNMDGTLQEAGAILWSDAGTYRVGRGLPVDTMEFQSERDVDYASGCGLLVPRRAWDDIGGFDAGYFPAYFEDVDLCLRLRSRGYRIAYAPLARVRHHAGASSLASDRAFAAQRNGRRFREKWAEALGDYEPQPPAGPDDPAIARALARTATRPLTPSVATSTKVARRRSAPTEVEALRAQLQALRADADFKQAYLVQLSAEKHAAEAELARVSAKVSRLQGLARRIPFGYVFLRWLVGRLGPDSTRPQP